MQAPEQLEDEFCAASEVYSFAIIVWEMLTGGRPWRVDHKGRTYNDAAIVMGVISGERPPLPADPSRLKFELQSLLASSGLPRFGAPPARAPRPHPRRCSRRTVPARAPFRLASGAKELALLGSILSRQREAEETHPTGDMDAVQGPQWAWSKTPFGGG